MKYLKVPFVKAFLFAICYGAFFYAIQFFLVQIEMFAIEPSSANLKSWDVGFYDSIRQSGYDAHSDNTGFFILFPFLWKISGLGVWGITILNMLFFALGFAFLMRTIDEEDPVFWLLALTLPSVYFAFLPYTESLFFLLGSLILYSIKAEKYWLLWFSLLFISLVRATGVFLLPAFIAMELLSNPAKLCWKSLQKILFVYATPMMFGLGVFLCWQYAETGIWFAYFKKQADHWGHTFALPTLPFSNIENGTVRYHWLSAIAMLVDAVALIFLIWRGVLWLKNKVSDNKILLLSAGYLTMVLMSLLFLNPHYGCMTNIMGANRYTIITPFFFVFIHSLYKQKYAVWQILCVFVFISVFWYLFGAYDGMRKYIAIAMINNLLIVAFILFSTYKKYHWLVIPIIAVNFFVQLHMFQQFITPLYVD